MATFLPLLSLALVVALLLVAREDSSSPREGSRWPGAVSVFALSALVLLLAYVWRGWGSDAVQAGLGFLVGAVGVVGWSFLPLSIRTAGAWGFAGGCAGLIRWMPADWHIHAQLGIIAGAAMASWLMQVRTRGMEPLSALPVAVAATIAADLLGMKTGSPNFNSVGTLLATSVAASVLVSAILRLKASDRPAYPVLALILLAGMAFAIGQRYLGLDHVWILFIAGMILGVVSNWLLEESGTDALRPLVAAILWVGLATIGFALRRGLGMSLGFMGGAATLILLNNPRALLTMGPLAGLVMYRVFREEHIAATRALDIGQHYALIGLLAGAMLPLCAVEWLRSRSSSHSPRLTFAGAMWIVLLSLAPVVAAVIMGPKGVVGFVAGLGVAALIESLRPQPHPQALSLGVGLSAVSTLVFTFLGDSANLTREQKTSLLLPLAGAALVLILLLTFLSPRTTATEAAAQ